MLPVNKAILMGVLAGWPMVQEDEGDSQMVGLLVLTDLRLHDASDRQQADEDWHRMVITPPDLAGYADTLDWQSLARILLWQDGTRIERMADHDCTSRRDARPADGGATGRAFWQIRGRGGLAMAGSRVDTPTPVHAFSTML